jgi:hypothetical protein
MRPKAPVFDSLSSAVGAPYVMNWEKKEEEEKKKSNVNIYLGQVKLYLKFSCL